MNFAFYDFETTGTSPRFDQALQFAAILTDENFNELEIKDIRCRLSDHILPSPIAMAVTKVFPEKMLEPNRSAFDFAGEISDLVEEWNPAIWTGYNSLSFDENVCRQLFYQNLHPKIYATQIGGNRRLDILKAVYACWGLGKTELHIPIQDNGKPTSKLDMLAPANGFPQHDAHNALGDVRATIHVAKKIRDELPDVWAELMANIEKPDLMRKLKGGEVFQLVERFGGRPPRIYKGFFCGVSEGNHNQFGFFDIEAADIRDYLDGNNDLIQRAVTASPKIIRTVDLNKMPLLFPANDATDNQIEAARLAATSDPLQDAVGFALANRYADREGSELVEAQIYDNFISDQDVGKLVKFQNSSWEERANIIEDLSDPRLRELGSRLIVLNAPEFTSEDTSREFWAMISRRWNGEEFYGDSERDPGNTYESVARDLQELETSGKFAVSQGELAETQNFFRDRRPEPS